jgi:hypothetical protein
MYVKEDASEGRTKQLVTGAPNLKIGDSGQTKRGSAHATIPQNG